MQARDPVARRKGGGRSRRKELADDSADAGIYTWQGYQRWLRKVKGLRKRQGNDHENEGD